MAKYSWEKNGNRKILLFPEFFFQLYLATVGYTHTYTNTWYAFDMTLNAVIYILMKSKRNANETRTYKYISYIRMIMQYNDFKKKKKTAAAEEEKWEIRNEKKN